MTRVMRGGRHRCIRSHCVAFDCTPGPPITLLPRSIRDVTSYRVVMVGDFTEGQLMKVRKMHRVRAQVVREVFDFYKNFNALYENVFPNADVLNTEKYPDNAVDDIFFEYLEDSDEHYQDGISAESENVRGGSDSWCVSGATDESTVLERRVSLTDDSSPLMASNHPLAAQARDHESQERDFMIRQSNRFSRDMSGDLFARIFPHFFPFGRGHPGEHRLEPVSLKECIKHYITLSERQFAEDELFALVAFDMISMMQMYVQNSIRCQRFPHLYDGFESIGIEELGGALLDDRVAFLKANTVTELRQAF
jgi:hypothetical protein